MKFRTAMFIAAFICALPILILLANLTMFAFVGHGFLAEGDQDINGARGVVGWLSAMGAVVIVGFGVNK